MAALGAADDEPAGQGPETADRTRWRFVLLALCFSLTASWVAPDAWPAGPGKLRIRHDGQEILSATLPVGSTDPWQHTVRAPGVSWDVAAPGGIPVDGRVEFTLRRKEGDGATSPDPGAVRASLELPDGRTELLPALRGNGDSAPLLLSRRPTRRSDFALALLALVVVLWITEAVPLFVTSLSIPFLLVVSGSSPAADALAPFFSPIIVLFFGGFLMAEAMRRVGLDRRIAAGLVAGAGRTPATLFAALVALSAFFSMWMSNTAACAVLIPIALAVTASFPESGYRRALVLGIAYAATMGGVGSAIGTPANPIAIQFLEDYAGVQLSFSRWFLVGLPLVLLMLPVIGLYLWRRMGVRVDPDAFEEIRARARDATDRGRLDGAQIQVLGVFGLVVAAWLSQGWHGVHPGIVALGGVLLLALLGRIQPVDLGRISWASLLTFGGGLALGAFITESGTSDWVATRLAGLGGTAPLLAIAVVATVALGLTTVASNTATAAILIPLAIPLAGVLDMEPTRLVLIVAVACSIDFALVIGTPPTMMAYSTGLFTAGGIFRMGILLDVVGLVLLVTAVDACWSWFGLF